jgi:hypothetical protein
VANIKEAANKAASEARGEASSFDTVVVMEHGMGHGDGCCRGRFVWMSLWLTRYGAGRKRNEIRRIPGQARQDYPGSGLGRRPMFREKSYGREKEMVAQDQNCFRG